MSGTSDPGSKESPPTPRGGRWRSPIARALAGLTFGTLQVVGWGAALAVATTLVLERAGWINVWVERLLARVLVPAFEDVSVESTDLRPFYGGATLRGVTLGSGGEDLSLQTLDLFLGWSFRRGFHLKRAVVTGGEVRISTELLEGVQELARDWAPPASQLLDRDAVPTIVLREFRVAFASEPWGEIAVGVVDLCLNQDEDDQPILSGRLVSPSATAGGSPSSVYLSGNLSEGNVLELRGSARDLPLAASYLPQGAAFDVWRRLEPRAVFDLEVETRYVIGTSVLPEVEARFSLAGGSLRFPHVTLERGRVLENVAVQISGRFQAGPEDELSTREAWDVRGHATASWAGTEIEVWSRVGRPASPGILAEVWLDCSELALDETLLDLLGRPKALVDGIWPMLAPDGHVGFSAGARLPIGWKPADGLTKAMHRALIIQPRGRASAAYHGGPNLLTGKRDVGFPLRLERLGGHVIYAFDPKLSFPEQFGIFALEGEHGSGRALVEGSLFGLPQWFLGPDAPVWMAHSVFWIRAESERLAVDARLAAAFRGLSGVVRPEDMWERYSPLGGELGFELEMWSNSRARKLATDLDIRPSGVQFTIEEFPLPLRNTTGLIGVRVDGRKPEEGGGNWVITLDLAGEHEAVDEPVRVVGHIQGQPALGRHATVAHVEVRVGGLHLRNPELSRVVADKLPALAEVIEATDPRGSVDLLYTLAKPHPNGAGWTTLEVVPAAGGVAVRPRVFPMETRNVRGRALVAFELSPPPDDGGRASPPPVETSIQPLIGEWGEGDSAVTVAMRTRLITDGPVVLELQGAGLDSTDEEFLANVTRAIADSDPDGAQTDLSTLGLRGHFDFSAEIELAEDGADTLGGAVAFDLYPRRMSIGSNGATLLRDVVGKLVVEDGEVKGEHLQAVLGRTPVQLEGFRRFEEDGVARLVTRITARGLPLDREHLLYFLDEETLDTLFGEIRWRGRVDFEDALLEVTTRAQDDSTVRFTGSLLVSDMFAWLGVPISVRSARVVEFDLVLEGDHVRVRAVVEELYGQVAGRQIGQGQMLLTYLEPHLSIEEFSSNFEGGRLRAIGKNSGPGARFFSMDLEEPFPFWLSMEMVDVDLRRFLRGLFNSEFANEGRLSGFLDLHGNTEHPTSITGTGRVRIEDSSLWSIPVFQALFSQLGFDTTAIFEEMEANLTFGDGVIDMPYMRMKSPLLSLVGRGQLYLDGRLDHDLEVRYGIVDRLGPITWLLYKIQNELLRVSIRGDLERPKVAVRGLLSPFFFGGGEHLHELPLPGPSQLPRRF